MGVFIHIFGRITSPAARRCALVAVVLTLVGPAASRAGDPSANGPEKRSVSTSPARTARGPSSDVERRASTRVQSRPLTRAAAQRRIERMSPARWLARFGDVSIDPVD